MMTAANQQTRLFTVRIWQERAGADQREWRGKVQALPEGDVFYFRDWPGLIAHLQTMLDAGYVEQSNPEPQIGRQL
jgi:hypothetical protein